MWFGLHTILFHHKYSYTTIAGVEIYGRLKLNSKIQASAFLNLGIHATQFTFRRSIKNTTPNQSQQKIQNQMLYSLTIPNNHIYTWTHFCLNL